MTHNYDRTVANRFAAAIPFEAIRRLTSRNLHAEALILGASSLGFKALAEKFELIKKIQKLEGNYMPKSLGDYNYILYKELMHLAVKKLSSEDYEKFHNCF